MALAFLKMAKKKKKVSGICRFEDVWNKTVNREEKMNQGGGGNIGVRQFQKFRIEECQT